MEFKGESDVQMTPSQSINKQQSIEERNVLISSLVLSLCGLLFDIIGSELVVDIEGFVFGGDGSVDILNIFPVRLGGSCIAIV